MSGIIGIVNLDGSPVDKQLLWRMTKFMSYRGPDAQTVWVDGNVGFGHTMLRTTRESFKEQQPCSVNRKSWIVADARIDGRRDLIQSLRAEGCEGLEAATDLELILHAYHTWGEQCVAHLIGDFAFAIWDAQRQRLFCVRDHLGIKPFYYARMNDCILFSNTLNCLKLHPAISDELNDLAIGDFLLFGFNRDVNTTTFADIKRLPSAHHLSCSQGIERISRYWMLPTDGCVRYRRAGEYVDHFTELLGVAVEDRLRSSQIAVSMSGGLDSPSIAAIARKLLSKRSEPFDLRAFTIVYDRLIPDNERYWSGLVADALDIPIHYLEADGYTLFEQWDQPELQYPEPTDFPLSVLIAEHLRQIAPHSRVALSGEGGDPAFLFSWTNLADTLKSVHFARAIAYTGRHFLSYRRFPRLGFRTMLKHWLGKHSRDHYSYPAWLNESFAMRLDLPARLEQIDRESAPIHPTRPEAYNNYMQPAWVDCFERGDIGTTQVPVEIRYPFFDIRLVSYLLAIPPMPWCANKELLRRAMQGILPDSVRLRPKTSLAGNPVLELLRRPETRWIDHFEPDCDLAEYIDRDAIPQITGEENSNSISLNIRPISLNFWLRKNREFTPEMCEEEEYEVAK